LRGEQRQRVAVPPERQFRGPAKNTIKGMSDMKKIKTKLVTFVTDNVRLVGIVGDKAPQTDRLESASVLRDVSGLKAFHNEADT
jgi:hypothetical protein